MSENQSNFEIFFSIFKQQVRFVIIFISLPNKKVNLVSERKTLERQIKKMNKNPELEALLKARRKNLGQEEEQSQKVQKKQQTKTQKPMNQQFLQKKKFLQANLFRQNLPKEQKLQQKPKQQIKGNSQAMKNAKALLEAKLNFANQNTGFANVSLPPPPGLPNLPPPPGLPNLPPPPGLPNLPPPPGLPNLPPPPPLNMPNLPPPPPLNMPNLPPPPSLPNNLPPPPPLPNNLPPPPSLPNLPPPPTMQNTNINLPPPPPFNPTIQQTSNNQPILPSPPSYNPPVSKNVSQQQIPQKKTPKQSYSNDSGLSSNRTSSKISQQQFRMYENRVRKQNSVDKKKSIFGNQPMLKSTNKPSISQPTSQNVKDPIKQSKTNESKPLQTPTAWTQPKQKKKIFKQKQNSLTSQFFGKDIAGLIKRQFLKTNDVLSYIDKKLPQAKTKQKVRYIFPSIFKGTRGQEGKFQFNFEPHETLYIDTKTLNVSGSFLVNNLNTLRTHNDSYSLFANKLKSYDIAKDPEKLQFKAIKELVENLPKIEYSELNLAKIHSCVKKCDLLIKQKSATEEFEKCAQIKQMRNQLMKMTQKYCKYQQDCGGQFEAIERMLGRIRDIQLG